MNDTPHKLEEMPLPELRSWYENLKASQNTIKARMAAIDAELVRRTGDTFAAQFREEGKQSGDITALAHGMKLKASISKKVEWNSDMLLAAAGKMPWEKAQQIFKFELSVPEKIYTALTDDALKAELSPARTVKYGELKVSFTEDKRG